MNDDAPLSSQIAASIEDVKILLANNRSLSVGYLSQCLKDVEAEARERLRTLERSQAKRFAALETVVEKLSQRLDAAGIVCKVLREEVDTLKRGAEATK